MLLLLILSTLATGLFAGAAVYINLVEHPARVSGGTDMAIREFVPSYRRASVMQASLAIVGATCGLIAGWQQQDGVLFVAALLIGAVVPFTLVIMAPTNKQLLSPALDRQGPLAAALLRRWAALHAVRSVLSAIAFAMFVVRLAGG
jgi:uncharacterized membrane protein